MLKRSVTATILFICLTTVASGIANAQGRDRIEVQIPFSFILREQTLPAGKYVVERTDPSRPKHLDAQKYRHEHCSRSSCATC